MATLFDRLSERLGGIIDDVRVPADLARRLDQAEQALLAGDAATALANADAVERTRPGLWRTRVITGLAAESLGDYERAATVLNTAAEQRDDTVVRVALGRVATQLGALRTAREQFDRALERRPDDSERLEILRAAATLDERIGPPSRAVPTLRQALRLAPHDPELMVRLAIALEDDGDIDAAIHAVAPALELDPAPLDALLLSGTLRLGRGAVGDSFAARTGYERILERSPDHPDALAGLGDVCRVDGQVADALPHYQHALQTAPQGSQARLHRAIGECYERTRQYQQAYAALTRATELDEEDGRTWLALARVALELGDADAALDAAGRGAAQLPDARSAKVLLGRAQLAAGLVDVAQRTLGALRAARMSASELRALGELALETNDPIEALALLREAAVADAGDPAVAALIERAVRQLAPNLPTLPPADELAPTDLAPFLESLGGAVARHPLLSDLVPRTTALRQHLDTPLTIAVLGEFNAGKSTLINAFLAEGVVATGVLPTTSHVNVVRYGPRKVARWTRLDETVEEVSYARAAELTKRTPEEIGALEFCFPHPELRSVHFWDTPGFNAPDDAHEERAREALRTADAVIWMLDANQALTSTEFSRIEAIPNRGEKLLVVLNKADRIGDDDEARAAIEAHVRAHMGDEMVGLYWLSALRALEARTDAQAAADGAGAPLTAGGDDWARFAQALQTQVFERAGRLKSLEVGTGLRALLRSSLSRADKASADMRAGAGAIERARIELATRASQWGGEVSAAARDELNRRLQEERGRIGTEIVQLATPAPGLFARRELADDDRTMLRRRVADRADASYRASARMTATVADEVDAELVAVVESIATSVGPPESRTLRRRLEAYLGETSALRRELRERLVSAPTRVVEALTRELGARILDLVATARSEAERDAALQRLLAPAGSDFVGQLDAWGSEYLRAATGLCDHVTRDLDILALDLEHRIIRPFSAVLDVIRSDDTDAATTALEPE